MGQKGGTQTPSTETVIKDMRELSEVFAHADPDHKPLELDSLTKRTRRQKTTGLGQFGGGSLQDSGKRVRLLN